MRSPERQGALRRTITAVTAVGALVALTGCSVDNPFKQDKEPTIQELYAKKNAKCANAAAATVLAGITPEQITQADSIKVLTDKANLDAAAATNTCVVEQTGIPTGTKGFDTMYPTIVIDANASVVQG